MRHSHQSHTKGNISLSIIAYEDVGCTLSVLVGTQAITYLALLKRQITGKSYLIFLRKLRRLCHSTAAINH